MRSLSTVSLALLVACSAPTLSHSPTVGAPQDVGTVPGYHPGDPTADLITPSDDVALVARALSFDFLGQAVLSGLSGIAIQNGGDQASVGMTSMTCTVETTTGTITDDTSYMPGDETPRDYDDNDDYDDTDDGTEDTDDGSEDEGNGSNGTTGTDDDDDDDESEENVESRLLLTDTSGNVGISAGRGLIDNYDVPDVKDAAFISGGVLAYSENPSGCRLTRIGAGGTLTTTIVPTEACGGDFAVDPATGSAWLANGDLWKVDAAGATTLAAAGAGDLVTFDAVSGLPVTAAVGGTTVSGLDTWTVQTDFPIRGLENLGALGAVVVVTDAGQPTLSHLIALEAAWGGVMLDKNGPFGFDSLSVDDSGTTLGVSLDNDQAVFYGITVL
jgi:hypothetical protein